MSGLALRVYHHLPPAVRGVVATARGGYLRWWRYGAETDPLADAALEREAWSAAAWTAWREERLARVLHRAATRVPYYRAQWAERRRRGDRRSWERLEHWPVLDKEAVRAHPTAFVADDCTPRRMFAEHTSGTSGVPVQLWWSRATVRAWYALFEARWRRWYGVTRDDRWAMLGGQLVTPVSRTVPPFWVWNASLHQLYLSAYHLAPRHAPHYLRALERYDVRYLWGYPSALVALAEAARDAGWEPPPLDVAVTNAEPVDAVQRATITDAFGCPVRETYGMAELVAAASECDAGRLHLWPEAGLVEVHDAAGAPVPPGESGAFVCTGLLNDDMPLVRYALGDRGALAVEAADGTPCACGRTLPVLARVEGRDDDVLFTRDGRRVGRLDPAFKARLRIRGAQIEQETLDRIRVRYVPAAACGPRDLHALAERLRERLGDVAIDFEAVATLPRTANGKVRGVICRIPRDERPSEPVACTSPS